MTFGDAILTVVYDVKDVVQIAFTLTCHIETGFRILIR